MKRPQNNDNNGDLPKRQALDRSFETVSTIESNSDTDDHPFGHVVGDSHDLNINNESFAMSFEEFHSNIVSQDDNDDHPPTSDPICTFTDDEDSLHNYPQNILAGLDDWQPTPGFHHSTTLEEDDILSSFPTEDEASQPFFDVANARIEPAPIPDFQLKATSYQCDKKVALDFVPDGPAANAMERISKITKEHAEWEARVRAEMAKLGSISRVYTQFDNATLFRIIECWNERGLVFGRCVQVRPYELEAIVNVTNENDDIISSEPTTLLPPYVPMEGEEEFTFLFSFAYIQSSAKAKARFINEECVAIWTPWTVISDGQREIYVATQFMSESLY